MSEVGARMAEAVVERGWIPDPIVRSAIRRRLSGKLEELRSRPAGPLEEEHQLVERLRTGPIAVDTEAANAQHYELPATFFARVLGRHLKYSCGLWEDGVQSLDQAEERMLEHYVERARLADGMRILDLGCGWGSLSLYLARRLPSAQITAVSNSHGQAAFIREQASSRGLSNLRVDVQDVNELSLEDRFDRVVSVEMFEHVRNHGALFDALAEVLRPGGQLFVHVFCHREHTYLFEASSEREWMARYFFQGGIMPSEGYLTRFQGPFRLLEQWTVDGRHYARTASAWLSNMDRSRCEIETIFREVYGDTAVRRWWTRWRLFFLACAELWGYDGGGEWYVAHYLYSRKEGTNEGLKRGIREGTVHE